MLGRQFPKVEAMLREAADRPHRLRQLPGQSLEEDLIHGPLERLNKEIKSDAPQGEPLPLQNWTQGQ